jgi:hypothetical protein
LLRERCTRRERDKDGCKENSLHRFPPHQSNT